MNKRKSILILTIFSIIFSFSTAKAQQLQIIAGAGPSTTVARIFFKEFAKLPVAENFMFVVPSRSIKHAGGIETSNRYLFGRTGRPLNEEEKKLNKEEIFLARVPIAFASGSGVNIDELTLKQIEDIYLGNIKNWMHVGGPNEEIELIGREPTEALFSILKRDYPIFRKAEFHHIVNKDNAVIDLINSESGKYALGFGSEPNLRDLNIIKINNFHSGVNIGLIYDMKNSDNPLVEAAIDYARSESWLKILQKFNLTPPN